MIFIVLFVIVFGLVFLASSIAALVARLIRSLFMVTAVAGASVLAGLIAGSVFSRYSSGDVGASVIGCGAVTLIVMSCFLIYRYRRMISWSALAAPKNLISTHTDPLDAAWLTAVNLLSPKTIKPIRRRCDALLAASEAIPLDLLLLEWSEFIRRRVPEMIAAVETLWADAEPPERRHLLDGLASDLDAIAAEAERRVEASQLSARNSLTILRRHVTLRTGAGGADLNG